MGPATKLMKNDEWVRTVFNLSHDAVARVSHEVHWVHTKLVSTKTTTTWSERKREVSALAQSAKCATVPIKHLCQVKALITCACLKHSDVTKFDNWIETSPSAVHMKLFSMMERVRHMGSTDSCPTADSM